MGKVGSCGSGRLRMKRIEVMRPEEGEKKYVSLLQNMDGNQRVKIGAELYETVCHVVESAIRNENPRISESELKEMLKQRIWG